MIFVIFYAKKPRKLSISSYFDQYFVAALLVFSLFDMQIKPFLISLVSKRFTLCFFRFPFFCLITKNYCQNVFRSFGITDEVSI